MPDPTTYIVLRRHDPEGHEIGDILPWASVGESRATSATAAIRAIAPSLIEGSTGLFVAVPARSWKPVTVKAETQTILKLEATT